MMKTLATLCLGLGLTSGMAATWSTDLNIVYTGTSPNGAPPWLTLTWTDVGMPANTIQFTIAAVGLTAEENVDNLYINFNDSKNVDALAFNYVSGQTASLIETGKNDFKAPGDGKYDILFSWPTGDKPEGFQTGETVVYNIVGAGITVADFNFLSAQSGGNPYQFIAAAHIQDTGSDGEQSGMIAVGGPRPVPDGGTAAMLLGMAFLGLGAVGRAIKSL